MTGRNCARPTNPKSRGRWVMSYTCHPIATPCIWEAKMAQSCVVQ
jgi:hypothetical protein